MAIDVRTRRSLRAPAWMIAALSGLLLSGCGEPASAGPTDSATDSTSTAAPTPTAPAASPTPTPAPAPTAETPPPPPPPPPPVVEQTVDDDQMKTVRKWLDDSRSGDEKKVQPALDNLKKMGNLAALPLAEIVAKDNDQPDRQVAAMDQLESLKFMNNPRAIEVVLGALDSANLDLKQRAIGTCGRHKIAQALPKLKAIMNDPAQSALKSNAAQALIELGDDDALTLAKSQLQSDSPVTRARAVYMIRKQGDSKNLSVLLPLVTDKDRDVRLELVEACGDLGGVDGVRVLGMLLDDGDHVIVRDSCKHLKRITGVSISREPEKWKEWIKTEFGPKGEAAFVKKGGAQPAIAADPSTPGDPADPKKPPMQKVKMRRANPDQPLPEPDGGAPELEGNGEGE